MTFAVSFQNVLEIKFFVLRIFSRQEIKMWLIRLIYSKSCSSIISFFYIKSVCVF